MSKALVEILGTAVSYLRSLRESADATEGFEIDLKKLAITATESARAQVKATVARDARLRSEITAYHDLGAAATRGSREQIAADNLAANAQSRLSRSLSVTAGESRRLSAASQHGTSNVRAFNREGERGVGIFHHFGRSLFYASSYLLGGYGLLYGLKSTLTASEDQRAEMGQLATAVRDVGLSYRGTRGDLNAILAGQKKLGFTSQDSIENLNLEVRATRSVKTAREALSLADNISRGRHVALSIAANAVAKAYGGQTGSLRRLLPFIGKGESAYQALKDAQAAYSGAAVRYANSEAGAQSKLRVALQATETTVGDQLAPTVQKLSTRLARWLDQSKNQVRIQKDVKAAVHDVGAVAHVLFNILKAGEHVVRDVDGATGSFKNTVIVLGGALGALKLAKAADALGLMASKALYGAGAMDTAAGSAVALDFALAPLVGTILAAGGAAVALGLALDKISSWIPGKPLQKLGKGIADLLNGTHDQAVSPAQARAEGAALLAKSGGIAAWNKAHPHAADPKAGGSAPGSSLASSAAQANALALASARTDAQKLAAYVEQRKIIAGEISATRRQLHGASGTERDLLINQLIDLSKQDTAAFKKVTALQKHVAHAAYQGAQTAALGLQAAADGAKSTGAIRKSYKALVDFYKREASDTHLTALERARYAKLAIDEQNKMGKAIVREQKAAARAVETAQLASLGVTKGSSIAELLQRVKDAATAKEQGQKYSIGLGPPGIKALKSEADQVSKALKGTYLDTDVSRGLITKIRGLLNGQLGALNSDMRNKIQQLLQGLKNDMKSFDGFDLSLADQHRRFLDRRFADMYGTGVANGGVARGSRLPRFKGIPHGIAATAAIQPSTINYHFSPNMQVIANEPIGHALDRAFFKQRIALGGVG